jgi:hypothetical protein
LGLSVFQVSGRFSALLDANDTDFEVPGISELTVERAAEVVALANRIARFPMEFRATAGE